MTPKARHRPNGTRRAERKAVADKRTITIEVSEHTAEALDYYQFLTEAGAAKIASSMVEYRCSSEPKL
jgi:hypothetical protein